MMMEREFDVESYCDMEGHGSVEERSFSRVLRRRPMVVLMRLPQRSESSEPCGVLSFKGR